MGSTTNDPRDVISEVDLDAAQEAIDRIPATLDALSAIRKGQDVKASIEAATIAREIASACTALGRASSVDRRFS